MGLAAAPPRELELLADDEERDETSQPQQPLTMLTHGWSSKSKLVVPWCLLPLLLLLLLPLATSEARTGGNLMSGLRCKSSMALVLSIYVSYMLRCCSRSIIFSLFRCCCHFLADMNISSTYVCHKNGSILNLFCRTPGYRAGQ